RIVLFEEEAAERGLDRRRISAGALRLEEERLRFTRPVERVRRARGAQQYRGIGGRGALPEDGGEDRLRVAAAADGAIQVGQLERSLTGRLAHHDRFEHGLRFAVLSAGRRELRQR